ncbi:hypothetical protein ACQKWADRAFT_200774 [Trichoderma austrokoningii]
MRYMLMFPAFVLDFSAFNAISSCLSFCHMVYRRPLTYVKLYFTGSSFRKKRRVINLVTYNIQELFFVNHLSWLAIYRCHLSAKFECKCASRRVEFSR